MIQGKGYELFCDNIFEQCLSLVNEYLSSVKTDEVNPDIVTTVQVTDSSSQDTDETMLKCCTVTDQAKSTLVVQGIKQLPKCIENTDKNSGMVNIPVPQSTKVGETSTDEKDSTNNIPDDNLRMLSTDYLEGLMDKRLDGHLKTYNQRLNVIETSVVKISEWASNSLEFQMMIKDRIIPAVNKVCNQINELQKKNMCS
jgi:hypothetical protein